MAVQERQLGLSERYTMFELILGVLRQVPLD